MLEVLLETKLYYPPHRPGLVARPRLEGKLALVLSYPLTLVCAPAGYGKTTLVATGLAEIAGSHGVAWLSLDEEDNDPVRFWVYAIAALRRVGAEAGDRALALLHSPEPPPLPVVLTFLLNDIAARPEPLVLILDDYHAITSQAIHDCVSYLLEHLPPNLHLLQTSRTDPPLSLARMRARGQLQELRAADLRFTAEEAAAFLQEVMGLPLTPKVVQALEARTEGWIAGLQLAALSMQGLDDLPAFVEAFSGSHRHLVDYLTEEVLARQPEPMQQFLLRTAGLVWAPLQAKAARFARTVNYDRAGLGWSQPGRAPRSNAIMVEELHALLHGAGLPGPYVLVGHSLGGLNARLYAHTYPDEVAGLVLIDAAHEEQFTPEPVQKAMKQMAWMMPLMAAIPRLLAISGLAALRPALLKPMVRGLLGDGQAPDGLVESYTRLLAARPGHHAAAAAELRTVLPSHAAIRALRIGDLGDRPLVVIQHGRVQPQMNAELTGNVGETNQRLQRAVVAQSTQGRLVIAEQSGHNIPFEQPELVLQAIREVVEAVSEGMPAVHSNGSGVMSGRQEGKAHPAK